QCARFVLNGQSSRLHVAPCGVRPQLVCAPIHIAVLRWASTDFSLPALFRNDQCARHVFVATATEDVASERELTSLSRRKTDAHHGTRFHLAANTKVRQTESMSDVL